MSDLFTFTLCFLFSLNMVWIYLQGKIFVCNSCTKKVIFIFRGTCFFQKMPGSPEVLLEHHWTDSFSKSCVFTNTHCGAAVRSPPPPLFDLRNCTTCVLSRSTDLLPYEASGFSRPTALLWPRTVCLPIPNMQCFWDWCFSGFMFAPLSLQ